MTSSNARKRKKQRVKGKVEMLTREQFLEKNLEMRVRLIQELIPIGLMFVGEELQREVEQLAGGRYQRKGSFEKPSRFGYNFGTVMLGNQRVPVRVPRVRDDKGDIQLRSYQLLHQSAEEETLFNSILHGLSCSKYESSITRGAGSIGTSRSTISRRFVAASAQQLKAFTERGLSQHDIVAIFIDGKSFAGIQMIIALGVTIEGYKVVLGFVEAGTENGGVIGQFFTSLLDRGMNVSKGILAVIDGGSGIRSAVNRIFKSKAVVQRCQWHKRENIIEYLAKSDQAAMRMRLQRAYDRPTLVEAKQQLLLIREELAEINQSSLRSFDEGFNDTLTLHRLGLFELIGRSFKTTNCIENINSLVGSICDKIDDWKNSSQRQRWLAAALRDIEPKLQKVKGYKKLPQLRNALMKDLKIPESRMQDRD